MGLHAPSGRVVVVTNVRGEMPDPARESRGALVVDLLRGTGRFADPDEPELDRFNAFYLFAVDATARLFTNRPGPRILPLTPGVHSLATQHIGRAGCRERECKYGEIPEVGVSITKTKTRRET